MNAEPWIPIVIVAGFLLSVGALWLFVSDRRGWKADEETVPPSGDAGTSVTGNKEKGRGAPKHEKAGETESHSGRETGALGPARAGKSSPDTNPDVSADGTEPKRPGSDFAPADPARSEAGKSNDSSSATATPRSPENRPSGRTEGNAAQGGAAQGGATAPQQQGEDRLLHVVGDLEELVENLTTELAKLRAEKAGGGREESRRLDELHEKVDTLQAKKEEALRVQGEFEGKVDQLQQDRERLNATNDELKNDKGRLERKCEALQEDQDHLENERDEVKAERDKIERERDQARRNFKEAQRDLEDAQGKLQRRKQESEELRRTMREQEGKLKYARSTKFIGALFEQVQRDQVGLFDDWRGDLASFSSFSCLLNYSLLRWVQATLDQRPEELQAVMQHNLAALMDEHEAFRESRKLLQEKRREQDGGGALQLPSADDVDPVRTAALQRMVTRLSDQHGIRLSPFYVDVDANEKGRKEALVLQ